MACYQTLSPSGVQAQKVVVTKQDLRMNIERLKEIETELMKIQHELQVVIRVDSSIQSAIQYDQRYAIEGISNARHGVSNIIRNIELN